MEQVAKMIGVKLDEEFKVKNGNIIYKINTNGLFYLNIDKEWVTASYMLMLILAGQKEIEKKTILNEAEKEYLRGIIKPFRDRVQDITKVDLNYEGVYEFIRINHDDYGSPIGTINLPNFRNGDMYKGMVVDKEYSVGDLEL